MLPLAIPVIGLVMAGTMAFNSFLLPPHVTRNTEAPSIGQVNYEMGKVGKREKSLQEAIRQNKPGAIVDYFNYLENKVVTKKIKRIK